MRYINPVWLLLSLSGGLPASSADSIVGKRATFVMTLATEENKVKCPGTMISSEFAITAGECILIDFWQQVEKLEVIPSNRNRQHNLDKKLCWKLHSSFQIHKSWINCKILERVYLITYSELYRKYGLAKVTLPYLAVEQHIDRVFLPQNMGKIPRSSLAVNNIALIKLANPVTHPEFKPAKLPDSLDAKLYGNLFDVFAWYANNMGVQTSYQPCVVNGRGPQKFRPCKQVWTFDTGYKNITSHSGCTKKVPSPSNIKIFQSVKGSTGFVQRVCDEMRPETLCAQFLKQFPEYFESNPKVNTLNLVAQEGNGSETLGQCWAPVYGSAGWCATSTDYSDMLTEGRLFFPFDDNWGFCKEDCNAEMDGKPNPNYNPPMLFQENHFNDTLCKKIWKRELAKNLIYTSKVKANILCHGVIHEFLEEFYRAIKSETGYIFEKTPFETAKNYVVEGGRTCHLRSGTGILQRKPDDRDSYVLFGVFYYGTGVCGGINEASISADIRPHVEWINRILMMK